MEQKDTVEVKTYDNRARTSSYIITIFSWILLLAGFILSMKYLSDAAAIEKLGFSSKKSLEGLQNFYYFCAVAYPASGILSFATLNVLNAIYIKLYPQDPKIETY